MTDYAERYSSYSTKDLLAIINAPGKYQAAAIIAAKAVIASRNLSDEEITTFKSELKEERDAETKLQQQKKEAAERLKNSVGTFASEVNPISATRTTASKTVNLVSIVFGCIVLVQIASQWDFFGFMFTDVRAKWGFEMLLYFLPVIFLPVAVALFAFRKKAGWIMLAIYLTCSAASGFMMLVWNSLRTPSAFEAIYLPQTSPVIPILSALFFGGTLWVICKQSVREIFKVEPRVMRTVIIGSALLMVVVAAQMFG